MRKQLVCSKCGFPCSSTCRSLNLSIPEILKACRLKESNNKVIMDPNSINELSVDEMGTKNNLLTDQISPSSSTAHENVAFSVGEIGMIFGNLTFDQPNLIVPAKSLELKVKSEVVTADDNFYSGESSKPSSTIQIKQEYERVVEAKNEAIWDSKKVKKKKRSKLPQYTLAPLARFINQLRHAPCRRPRRLRAAVVVGPKYDDVLIYEKCLHIPENEIGLGAELLEVSPAAAVYGWRKSMIKEESSSTVESGSTYSTGLIDVPIN